MNKVAIKNFAVEARRKLIASVKDKAGRIGITKENITEAISKGEGYAVFPTHIGIQTTLTGKELKQRENLVNRIKEKGYESVMEEVAYTWFNRIIAVRFMEVNDYLPSRIRVLSSETKGKFEPDIVTLAPKIELELTQQEIEEIISLKEKNELDKLFRQLFIRQCNELGKILPELFENTSIENKDYTEILLDISFTNEDGVVRDILNINEEDFMDAVEIIGWMYQYYISEPKDVLINAKNRYKSEEVPFVTQLFTSDWIVRYMVENSLGRLWAEGHSNDTLKVEWKYYLDETAQDPEVIDQLNKSKAESKNINPEEIKVIDPCMGSGHILVYAFDVLMQIYESCGYSTRDAASLIIEKNLYGLDIDDRAYQLAYFAVMMKARKFDRRIFAKNIKPNLCSIQESNTLIPFNQVNGQLKFDDIHLETANYLIRAFKDAKEYGSILNIEPKDYDGFLTYIGNMRQIGIDDLFMSSWLDNVLAIMPKLIKQAKIIAQKYDVVSTNPPYLNSKFMPTNLKDFIEGYYSDYKSDMFAAFMVKCSELCKINGHIGLVTPYVWMFISSYEKLRANILSNRTISSLIQLEYNAFEAACVPVCAFTLRNYSCCIPGEYIKLSDFKGIEVQAPKTIDAVRNRECGYRFTTKQQNFMKIPGMPISYWISEKMANIFTEGIPLSQMGDARSGMQTGNNDLFLKLWFEVEKANIGFDFSSLEQCNLENKKWIPQTKGGSFRKWYGNFDYVVNFKDNGSAIRNYEGTGMIKNPSYYFREGITWSHTTSAGFAARFLPKGFIFNVEAPALYSKFNLLYLLGLLNTNITDKLFGLINQTFHYLAGDMEKLPVYLVKDIKLEKYISSIVEKNISISKLDWDSFETSWNFEKHPLTAYKPVVSYKDNSKDNREHTIKDAFHLWNDQTEALFNILKSNEEELNRIFIEIYSLQDELTPEIDDNSILIRKANMDRDIRSFISYSVGCMFGRYSLDVGGLVYAGGEWDENKYKTFKPVQDNIIPITDEEYFDEDIVGCFIQFVKMVYGPKTLEENLDFIANSLGNKGNTSRDVIRNYFLKDFYKDHCNLYTARGAGKRPIYWLFESGKENGFKALIYLHRYNEDTVGRVRADYLHKTQAAIENAIAHCDVVLESNTSVSDKAKAVKQKEKLVKQLAETRIYDQAIAHIAHQRISLDLDDGVVVNYAKFQGITVASEGKKSVKVDLLAKI